MKKLKKRLERNITNILSNAVLFCDGKGCFRVSAQYRFPLTKQHFFLDITKNNNSIVFSYHVILCYGKCIMMDTTLDYNIYEKDIPIYQAYTAKDTRIIEEINNVPGLKRLIEKIKEDS